MFTEIPITEDELISYYFKGGFKYNVIVKFLEEFHGITMSLRTLKRRLCNLNLRKNDDVSDHVIKEIIRREIQGPGCLKGYRSMWHHLRSTYSISSPRNKVMVLLKQVDPAGTAARMARRLARRRYVCDGANAVWHVDGYDKVKPYGFPIHGCIDGFSRKIIWLELVRSNNDPYIPAYFYLKNVEKFGFCPEKVRTDAGNENGLMASIQCKFLASISAHQYGSSHFNQRIENYWSHCKRGFTAWIIDFFKDLVNIGYLDGSHIHSEACWFAFSALLQAELDELKQLWNTHYIRQTRHDTVPGRPDELFFFPESRNHVNCKQAISYSDVSAILNEDDVFQIAEDILHDFDEDLYEYFCYVRDFYDINYPPKNWQDARALYVLLVTSVV